MGSLDGSGIPVVSKQSVSFRKNDIKIKSTNSTTDVISTVTSNRPELSRPIGSGSIVRESGVVDHYEELVFGHYLMGRNCEGRIASDTGCVRAISVDLNGGETLVVIESGLVQPTPQYNVAHHGELISIGNSIDNTHLRVSSSGAFD